MNNYTATKYNIERDIWEFAGKVSVKTRIICTHCREAFPDDANEFAHCQWCECPTTPVSTIIQPQPITWSMTERARIVTDGWIESSGEIAEMLDAAINGHLYADAESYNAEMRPASEYR